MSKAVATILRLFREAGSGFVSGERISCELQISRSAVWKYVNQLRNAGYIINAVPSRGYYLISSPDILSEDEIRGILYTKCIGRRLVCFSHTESTNADAFRLADEGAEEGTVVIADAQIGGRGRRGRSWASPPGVNLYCSIILRPAIMPHEAPQLTFLSAVAVARAIELTSTLKPEIKWPNDVLINGRKLAGLLNEMSAETDGIKFVILGIGVNLNMTSDQFPTDLRSPATSLMLEQNQLVKRAHFAATMLGELDRLYNDFLLCGFGHVRDEWQQRCNANKREIVVSEGTVEIVRGIFNGVDYDGALLIRSPNGEIVRILSGDVRVT